MNINFKDPLIAEWAVMRLKYLKKVNTEEAEKFEQQHFTEENIKLLLENPASGTVSNFARTIEIEKLSPFLYKIIELWNREKEHLVIDLPLAISEISPETALEIYEEKLFSGRLTPYGFMSLLNGIEALPEEEGKDFICKFLDFYEEKNLLFEGYGTYIYRILALAWQYDHKSFLPLLKAFALENQTEDSFLYKTILRQLCFLLTGSDKDYLHIQEYMDCRTQDLFKNISILYKEPGLPSDFDSIIKDFAEKNFKKASSFISEYMDFIEDEKVKKTVGEIFKSRNNFKQSEGTNKTLFYTFFISVILSYMRKKEVREEELTLEKVMTVIKTRTPYIVRHESFFEVLKKEDRKTVADLLIKDLISKDGAVRDNIAIMMGKLSYEEFFPHLLKTITYTAEEVVTEAFYNYKEEFFNYGNENFKDLETGDYIVLSLTEKMGIEKISLFLENNFTPLLLKHKGSLKNLLEYYPHEKFIDKLKPYINRGQIEIDESFVILSKLFEKETPEVKAMEEKVIKVKEDMKRNHMSVFDEDILESAKPYIDMKLKCNLCSDESVYRVNNVLVNYIDEEQSMEIFVQDELSCLHCNKTPEFTVTFEGRMAVQAEFLKLQFLKTGEEQKKFLEMTPVKMLRTGGGKSTRLSDDENFYLEEIEKNPGEVSNYIKLGNVYFITGRHKKAEINFKRALEISPIYIDLYYSLGEIYMERNDYKKAFYWLEKGLSYIEFGQIKVTGYSASEFQKLYLDFYNEIAGKIGRETISFRNYKKTVKVGRNDPCPCGSGKKYKKCCLKK